MREMKDSGVSWIGEIPADWEIVPWKSHFSHHKGLPITKADLTETGIPIISYGQIHSKMNSGTHVTPNLIRFVSDKYMHENPQSLAQKGDILFADTSEDYSGIGNCVLVDVDLPLFAGYHTIIARPQDGRYSKYLAYLFQTDNWRSQLRFQASGIKVYSVTQKMLKNLSIVLPPVKVGEQIVAYLDTKCAKIGAIIARQQQVIEKLKAYKLSVINEAIAGAGGVHCHLGHIAQMKNGLNFGIVPSGNTINFLGVGNFKDYFVLDDQTMFSEIVVGDDVSDDYMLRNGDIIFVRSNGSKELVGRSVMVDNINFPLTYSGFCIRFRNMRPDILSNSFLLYFFHSPNFRKQLEKYSQGSNIRNINQELLSQISIAVPQMDVQTSIVTKLKRKCLSIDKLIRKKETLIDSLTEYKKSLIYEVVTGKREIKEDLSSVTSVVVLTPALIAELREKRAALMTRFIDGLGDKSKGRTQIQKCMSLAEGLIDLQLGTQLIRQHYGPYDEDIQTYEQIMAEHEWVNHAKKKGRIQYTRGKRFQEYHNVYQRFFGDYDCEIQRIIDFVKPIKHTSEIGRMATLFAAWNDFILDGIPNPTDAQIISEVRSNWTDNKANTPIETWQDSLGKLRAAGMVPHGYGRHTIKLEEGDRTRG